MYGLSAGCFTKLELRRLDGFQAKCLRTVLGVAPSFVSRISNACVRSTAGWKPASQVLMEQQLLLLGKVLRSAPNGPLQKASFIPGTIRPATDRYVRRVGRPRREWVPHVIAEALGAIGGEETLTRQATNTRAWRRQVIR